MKIALISDIHANLPALQAVLKHAITQEVSTVWALGDYLGYGAFPNEVIRLLVQVNALCIIGNYDQKVLGFDEKYINFKAPIKYTSFSWTYAHLNNYSRLFLESLPNQRIITKKNRDFLLVHGSPTSVDDYITPDTDEWILNEYAQLSSADYILCGHSHIPFTRHIGNKWFINPGSVGMVEDLNPKASYMILEITKKQVSIFHFRIAYDVNRAVRGIKEAGLPDEFAIMVQEGISLKELQRIKRENQIHEA
jgi:putative phosphoesterase